MTDFWRLANALIVAVIILAALFWGRKRKKRMVVKAVSVEPERLLALKARRQKLADELEGYDAGISELEAESRQMVDAVLNAREAQVTQLVREESRVLLDEMHAAQRARVEAGAAAVKNDFAKRLDGQDS